MLSFLLLHYKKYKKPLITTSGVTAAIIGFLWNFELQKLTPSGTLEAETLWKVRMVLTLILFSLYLLSLLVLTLIHYKKDIAPLTMTPQERWRITESIKCPHCDNKIFDVPNKAISQDMEDPEMEKFKRMENLERALSSDGKSTIDRLIGSNKKSNKQQS